MERVNRPQSVSTSQADDGAGVQKKALINILLKEIMERKVK